MKNKKLLIATIVGVVIVAASTGLIYVSDQTYPGKALYSLDRGTENIRLYFTRNFSKYSYAKFNLKLATERASEIKAVQNGGKTASLMLSPVSAQSPQSSETEVISQLLDDITRNYSEAKAVLGTLEGTQKEQLSIDISESSSEVGNTLSDVASEFSNELNDDLVETANAIKSADDDALDNLVEVSSSEDNDSIDLTLQQKLETRLLKYREQVKMLVIRFEINKGVIKPENIAVATTNFSKVSSELNEAELQIGKNEFKKAKELLDSAEDTIGKVNDLVKIEGQEDIQPSKIGDSSNEVENEIEPTEMPEPSESPESSESPEPSETPEPSEEEIELTVKTVTTTPRPTQKIEPTERPEPTEAPEKPEDPEEPEVEGERSEAVGFKEIAKNMLRF